MRYPKTIIAAKSGYIVSSILLGILGLILVLFPLTSVLAFCMAVGVVLIICGAFKLIGYFSGDLYRLAFQFDLAMGIFTILLGILLLIKPQQVLSMLHFLIGLYVLADGLLKGQTALDAKRFGLERWKRLGFTAIITAFLGLCLVLAPFYGAVTMMVFAGMTLFADGLLNLMIGVYAIK